MTVPILTQGDAGAARAEIFQPRRRKPQRVAAQDNKRPTVSLEVARGECRRNVSDLLGANKHFRFLLSADLIAYPPGVGKTQAVTDMLNNPGFDPGGEVLIIGPRHDLLTQISLQLQVSNVHIWPRVHRDGPKLCEYPDVAHAMVQKRLPMAELVCRPLCPVREGCPYYAQFKRHPKVTLATPQMARSPLLEYDANGGDDPSGGRSPRRWALVIYDDVDPIAAFTSPLDIKLEVLYQRLDTTDWGPFQPLLWPLLELGGVAGTPFSGHRLWTAMETMIGRAAFRDILAEVVQSSLPGDTIKLPANRMPWVEEIMQHPPWFVHQLASALLHDARVFMRGNDFNGLITAEPGNLRFVEPQFPAYLYTSPIMILDATPNEQAWRRAADRPLRVVGKDPVEMPGNVEIVQVADYFSGKGAFRSEKHMLDRKGQVMKIVRECRRPVVLVTFKELEVKWQPGLGEHGVQLVHFYSLRGLNTLEDVKALIVLGRPSPPTSGEFRSCVDAFYAGTPALDWTPFMAPAPYETIGAADWAVEIVKYGDGRVAAAVEAQQESELHQVIYRARPLSRRDPILIILITEHPVPGLPVHLTGLGGFIVLNWTLKRTW